MFIEGNKKSYVHQVIMNYGELIRKIGKHKLLSSNYNGRRIQVYKDGYIQNANYVREKFIDEFIKSISQEKIYITNCRGVGVSSFLTEIAKQFNLPLLVASSNKMMEIKSEYKNVYKVRSLEDVDSILELNSRYIICDNMKIDVINKLRTCEYVPIGISQNIMYV